MTTEANKPNAQPCESCSRLLEPRWALVMWLQPATCDACHEAAQAVRIERDTEEYLASAMRAAGISLYQLEAARCATKSKIDRALAAWCREPRAWAWVHGDYGTGKTTQALMSAAYYAKLHRQQYGTASSPRPVVFATEGALLERIKREGFDPQPYITAPRLIIDEVGVEERTAWGAKTLRHIVNERYNAHRATLFVSNHALSSALDACASARGASWGMWDAQMMHRIAERALTVVETTTRHRSNKIAGESR